VGCRPGESSVNWTKVRAGGREFTLHFAPGHHLKLVGTSKDTTPVAKPRSTPVAVKL
jgi:hypothetical protein